MGLRGSAQDPRWQALLGRAMVARVAEERVPSQSSCNGHYLCRMFLYPPTDSRGPGPWPISLPVLPTEQLEGKTILLCLCTWGLCPADEVALWVGKGRGVLLHAPCLPLQAHTLRQLPVPSPLLCCSSVALGPFSSCPTYRLPQGRKQTESTNSHSSLNG